ncbi:MAG: protein kinase [Deltaproteobacteria bacterium]|nr:protein kinase [Deltaproteobacteria bacterium]
MSANATAPGTRVGQRIADRYELVRLLGAGGMGEVYEGAHLRVGKRVAVKCLWPMFAADPAQVERFEREARVASMVDSPHMVDVLDAGALEDGTRFLVMELLDGVTLHAALAETGPLPIERALAIARALASGLAAAHAAGIVHRDLKPDNVFLVRRVGGELVKILDFGISKFRHPSMIGELTRTGVAMGTPAYMAPEQTEGLREVDARADVWSLGVIVFRMLSGALPFASESYARLLMKVLAEPAPALRTYCPEAPAELEAFVARCLEKSPDARFGSMQEVETELARIASTSLTGVLAPRTPVSHDEATRPAHGLRDSQTRRSEIEPDRAPQPVSASTPVSGPVVSRPKDSPLLSPNLQPTDELLLTDATGTRRILAREFLAMPLSARLQHVITGTIALAPPVTSLYERLGGEPAVEAAVVRFYEKVIADPSLAPFFDGLDLGAQIRKQIAFMTFAFGGTTVHSGRDLRQAHAGLVKRGLGGAHFDAVASHLAETLDELGVPRDVKGEVMTIVASVRTDVLGG